MAALSLLAGLAPAHADRLQLGEVVTRTLEGGAASFELGASAGSYVEGVFEHGASGQQLALYRGGEALRQLTDASGREMFRFVMPEGAELRVFGAEGSYSLQLTRIVAPSEQHAPEPVLLSPMMAQIARDPAALDRLWPEIIRRGTPLVEQTDDGLVVTFLYRGARQNVRLVGGPSNDHDWLARMGQSDLFYKSYIVAPDTRLSYQLAPDVPQIEGSRYERRAALLAVLQADPLNPRRLAPAPDIYAAQSVFDGPEAPAQAGYPAQPVALDWFGFSSASLGDNRQIALYQTPGYDPADPRALLVFVFDGPTAAKELALPEALAHLAREGALPPLAAVFIDPVDGAHRADELPGNPALTSMLADELLPEIAQRLGLVPDPARTVLAGASFGGIGALRIALERPDRFGAAIALSGSYWWSPVPRGRAAQSWMAERIARAERLPRVFMGAGIYETSRGAALDGDIWESNRQVAAVLAARGGEVLWSPWSGGHDGYVWRGKITEGLLALYGQN